MAKKIKPQTEKHVCGECANGTWVDRKEYPAHFTVDGEPISLRCRYCKYLVVRSQKACELFKTRDL